MLDHVVRCQSLRDDLLRLAEQLAWPAVLKQAIAERLRNASEPEVPPCSITRNGCSRNGCTSTTSARLALRLAIPPVSAGERGCAAVWAGLNGLGHRSACSGGSRPPAAMSVSSPLEPSIGVALGSVAQQPETVEPWPAVRTR